MKLKISLTEMENSGIIDGNRIGFSVPRGGVDAGAGKRESGEKPGRSGHCEREAGSKDAIVHMHEKARPM